MIHYNFLVYTRSEDKWTSCSGTCALPFLVYAVTKIVGAQQPMPCWSVVTAPPYPGRYTGNRTPEPVYRGASTNARTEPIDFVSEICSHRAQREVRLKSVQGRG